jgi:tRNA(Ile)-lysidine synthase
MSTIINKLKTLLEKYPKSNFCLAYSGGLDSQVLLHLLCYLLPTTRLRAIHVNHGLHRDASQWTKTCRQTCAALDIPCEVICVDAQAKQGESPEAYARQVRYAVLAERLEKGDCLLTAHHRDDQAETLLLQLLRGSGLRGLASMPSVMPFGQGTLIRPLLPFSRSELQRYAEAKQLTWIDDSSNADLRFNRNFIRHQILPFIQQRWTEASKTLARVAENTAEANVLLEALAHEDWLKVRGPLPNNIIISQLLQLTPERRRNCLRYWLKRLRFLPPSRMQLQQVEFLLESKLDAKPKVSWGNVQVRRYRDFLYAIAVKNEIELSEQPIPWDLTQTLILPAIGSLVAEQVVGQGISYKKIKGMPLTVNFRQGGERFHLQNRPGSHPLKKLFQEWGVPPWQREKVPLIYCQKELVAVAGYGINAKFAANRYERGYLISLESISP